jgi:hypothetical protein
MGLEPAYSVQGERGAARGRLARWRRRSRPAEAERAAPVAHTHDTWWAGAFATLVRRGGLPPVQPERVAPPYELLLAGDWRAAAAAWRERGEPYEEGLALLDSGDSEPMQVNWTQDSDPIAIARSTSATRPASSLRSRSRRSAVSSSAFISSSRLVFAMSSTPISA